MATTENCGEGHDTAQICCACTEKVKTRLWPAEDALLELDTLSLKVLIGTPAEQAEAQTLLGELLFGRVWEQAKDIITERMKVEAICPNYADVTDTT